MLNFGIDWDDVISPFNDVAISMANEEYGLNLTLEDIDSWENKGRAGVIKKYYADKRLYQRQTVPKEAKEFLSALRKKGNVYIVTAVSPRFMADRVEQILTAFPEFPEENIIMGFQKTMMHFDIILDDGPHNILKSSARFPVLFRRPWNRALTGVLSVNTYGEFFQMIEQIKASMIEDVMPVKSPSLIALVGPSGSNKNGLAECLAAQGGFQRVLSYTTAREDSFHIKVTEEEFNGMDFVTTTVYAGKKYGVPPDSVRKVLEKGIFPVIPLDICGAISMKRLFPTLIVFCKNSRENMIADILEKNISNEDKKYRLLSLEKELDNSELCDMIVRTENVRDAERKIRETIQMGR